MIRQLSKGPFDQHAEAMPDADGGKPCLKTITTDQLSKLELEDAGGWYVAEQ